ncbi:MAG: fumarylacetoacetate hydrolase family protein [Deltaproteobacteria bacterium]|nr:fumarylacetoacetate hydrolase family protein [Deltaproteobacteria bacterium]
MRYIRLALDGVERWGRMQGVGVQPLSGAPWEGGVAAGAPVPVTEVQLLAPVQPSKVVCVGQNYRKHAAEMGKPVPAEPLLFLKAPSSLNGPGSPILLPAVSEDVQHEAELGLVVGKRLKNASPEEAAAAIVALTCVNDVTARDIQRREVQHTRAKSYDTFCCVGPWLVPATSALWKDARVLARVNGQVRQDGQTGDMVFPPAELLSFISHAMTLMPGDLISTGTPAGVGRLLAGDVVEIEVEGIGMLSNPVVAA